MWAGSTRLVAPHTMQGRPATAARCASVAAIDGVRRIGVDLRSGRLARSGARRRSAVLFIAQAAMPTSAQSSARRTCRAICSPRSCADRALGLRPAGRLADRASTAPRIASPARSRRSPAARSTRRSGRWRTSRSISSSSSCSSFTGTSPGTCRGRPSRERLGARAAAGARGERDDRACARPESSTASGKPPLRGLCGRAGRPHSNRGGAIGASDRAARPRRRDSRRVVVRLLHRPQNDERPGGRPAQGKRSGPSCRAVRRASRSCRAGRTRTRRAASPARTAARCPGGGR